MTSEEPSFRPMEAPSTDDPSTTRALAKGLAGFRAREHLAILFFLTLPIGRGLVFDVGGFTIRPAYLPMLALIVLNLPYLDDGVRNMPAALLALIASIVSIAFSENTFLSLAYTLWATFTILFALTATGYLRTSRRIHLWIRLYVTTGVIWGWIAIGQWIAAQWYPSITTAWLGSLPRIEALTQEASYLAFYLVPIAFAAVGCRRFRAAGFLVAVTVLTTSRMGLVGLAAGFGTLLLLKHRLVVDVLRRYSGRVALAGLLLLALPPVRQGFLRFWGFVAAGVLLEDVTSAVPRLQTWLYAVEVFQNNPIVGVGLGGYGPALQDMGIATSSAVRTVKTTNLWLELLAETGLAGFTAFTAWAVTPLLHYRLFRRFQVSAGLLAAVVASMVMFHFIQTWWRPYLWLPWIVMAAWRPRPLFDFREAPDQLLIARRSTGVRLAGTVRS